MLHAPLMTRALSCNSLLEIGHSSAPVPVTTCTDESDSTGCHTPSTFTDKTSCAVPVISAAIWTVGPLSFWAYVNVPTAARQMNAAEFRTFTDAPPASLKAQICAGKSIRNPPPE